jgi:hypothetical protein
MLTLGDLRRPGYRRVKRVSGGSGNVLSNRASQIRVLGFDNDHAQVAAGLSGLGKVPLRQLQRREQKLEKKIQAAEVKGAAAHMKALEQRQELVQRKIAKRMEPKPAKPQPAAPPVTNTGPDIPLDNTSNTGGNTSPAGGGDTGGGGTSPVDTDIDSGVPIDSLTEGGDPNAIGPDVAAPGSTPAAGSSPAWLIPAVGMAAVLWFLTRKKKRRSR